ncbi:MAG TPA: nucleotidyltransferase family protein, partial [Vicinamibacterales bacterium]|nr:nucleotidyltransferase family protein [Vicinamibacterales bacterium]
MTDRLTTVRAIDDWALQLEAGDAADRDDLRAAVARDLVQLAALRTAVNALAAAGIPALVMKGAALSFTCYPHHFRPRNDDDLLVAPADFDAASHTLARAGYRMTVQIDDVAVVGQRLFCRAVSGVTHHLDLHSRPLNPLAFADLPSFAALAARSIALPALGEHARAVGPVDALVLACAHRVA